MLIDRSEEALRKAEERAEAALDALAEEAVIRVRERMRTGYDPPPVRSGALLRDVRAERDGLTVRIGNTLPYAEAVHDGTAHSPGRPYLRDALQEEAPALFQKAWEQG